MSGPRRALSSRRSKRSRAPLAAERVEMRGGYEVPAHRLPFLRLREVVYHHVDLDAGFTFDDVEPELLRAFVGDAVDRLASGSRPPAVTLRTDQGDSWTLGEGTTTVSGSLGGLLLWLARRIDDGRQQRRRVTCLRYRAAPDRIICSGSWPR